MQRNRGKQQNEKDQRYLQEHWRYLGNTPCKDGHNKGQNDKDLTEAEEIKEKAAKIHRRTTQKRF